jgi:transcriptional regulator with XRE-family HTH domain
MALPAKKRATSPEQGFGAVLRELRLAKGISQESLAHSSGYHRTYIGQLERAEKSPSLRTIFNLASALGTSAGKMVEGVEEHTRR